MVLLVLSLSLTLQISNAFLDSTTNHDLISTAKPSKTSQLLSHLHLSSHRASKEKEEVPPRLQEAIDEMEERKARTLEDMEKSGQRPNTKTSQAFAWEYGGALN